MKKIVLLVAVMCLLPVSSYEFTEINSSKEELDESIISDEKTSAISNDDSDYYALLIAVGVYANNPDMDRPSMFVEVENIYETLVVSDHWHEQNIKVITGENATLLNMFQGFRWLDEMEDENDICLVYLTTHGFPILWDLPPFDEEDGMDEALACYRGFLPLPNPWSWEPLANPFGIITDDMINYFLNRLETQGLCVIVDSCHSGGFNDNWSYLKAFSEKNFAKELGKDLQGRNRVIMTSVPEEDTSYGSYFSHYLADGMKGYGDDNDNGLISAEEAFWYAEPIIREGTSMSPQIFDDFPGELSITVVELPPSIPTISGEEIGKAFTPITYAFYSDDPENDNIQYFIDWGDGTEELSIFYSSGVVANITHTWTAERTYELIVNAIDEYGAQSEWNYTIVTMENQREVDQRQVEYYRSSTINATEWVAQSFKPSLNKISKVELNIHAWNEAPSVTMAIKQNLSSDNLVSTTELIEPSQDWNSRWISFTFDEISLNPGEEYFIVCRSSAEDHSVGWTNSGRNNDVYLNGTMYYSEDAGNQWESRNNRDGTFVTYG